MNYSLNTYLRDLSYSYYIRKGSPESTRINTAVSNLKSSLKLYFGDKIQEIIVFGSYDRDTILKRNVDKKSDVDVMVVFKDDRTPETFRTWIKDFADKKYNTRYGTPVVKTFPTITVRLNDINFDLIPGVFQEGFLFSGKYYIPDENNEWRKTEPNDVKQALTNSNTKYNSIVKPIVRLTKAWNANVGHPFDSYELEVYISSRNYYNDTVESGFYHLVDSMRTDYTATQTQITKLESLKYNIGKMRECLGYGDVVRAKHWLHRVLPNN